MEGFLLIFLNYDNNIDGDRSAEYLVGWPLSHGWFMNRWATFEWFSQKDKQLNGEKAAVGVMGWARTNR